MSAKSTTPLSSIIFPGLAVALVAIVTAARYDFTPSMAGLIFAAVRDQLTHVPTGADNRVMSTVRLGFSLGFMVPCLGSCGYRSPRVPGVHKDARPRPPSTWARSSERQEIVMVRGRSEEARAH